jgi:hypothetical protein
MLSYRQRYGMVTSCRAFVPPAGVGGVFPRTVPHWRLEISQRGAKVVIETFATPRLSECPVGVNRVAAPT